MRTFIPVIKTCYEQISINLTIVLGLPNLICIDDLNSNSWGCGKKLQEQELIFFGIFIFLDFILKIEISKIELKCSVGLKL